MEISETSLEPQPGVFSDQASRYLDQRWLEPSAASKLRISGVGDFIWFPYLIDGKIMRWKARSITDKKFQFWTALPEGKKDEWKAPFFNQKDPFDTKYLIITEGELDCLALCQLGAVNCVSLPNGASSVESTFKNNYRFLQKFDCIYIAFDMDDAGNAAADKALKMLPIQKYRRINFPRAETEPKDANQWLIDTVAQPEDLCRLMLSATRPHSERIKNIVDCDLSFFQEIDLGVPTNWKGLNVILGGIRKQELTVVSAETGCGKTTFCLNLAAQLSNQGKSVWINSFEMDPKIILRKIASIALSKSIKIRKFQESERLDFYAWSLKHNIYLNPKNCGSSLTEIRKDFEIASLAFDVEYIILDHLDYIHSLGNNKTSLENIDETMRELHFMAMEFNVGVILVAHPRQIQGPVRPLSINDIKGSSAIKQYADNILLLTRMDTLDATKVNQVKLSVVKNRLLGTQSTIDLIYNSSTDSYIEFQKQINYKGNPYADN